MKHCDAARLRLLLGFALSLVFQALGHAADGQTLKLRGRIRSHIPSSHRLEDGRVAASFIAQGRGRSALGSSESADPRGGIGGVSVDMGEGAADVNPWRGPIQFGPLDKAIYDPVAPYDRLMPGIVDQGSSFPKAALGLPPTHASRAVYYSKSEDIPNPFPQHYPVLGHPEGNKETRANSIQCTTSPSGWVDSKGIGCLYYAQAGWCSPTGGPGIGWNFPGTMDAYAESGISAVQACCECGGGITTIVAGVADQIPLGDRRLISSESRVPDPEAQWFERTRGLPPPSRPKRTLQAPADEIPLPSTPVAPEDEIPVRYARYFDSVHQGEKRTDPLGLSARFYDKPPNDNLSPSASSIDRCIDYNMDPKSFAKRLEWPLSGLPPGGLWWGRWTGTLQIFMPGRYVFDLDIAFNTESTFKVDGQVVLTRGQCRVANNKPECVAKTCSWNETTGDCLPWASPPPPKEEGIELSAGGHCIDSTVMVTPGGKTLQLRYRGRDTSNTNIVIPGQVLFCDPVIPACESPELAACKSSWVRW